MKSTRSELQDAGVFLSHSHEDRAFATRLGNDLAAHGLRVWIDSAEINVGDSLIQKISEGLQNMNYLAVVLSKFSVQSEWVKKEVEIAMNHEIAQRRVVVLPILRDECDIPLFLKGKLYVDFRDDAAYRSSLKLLLRRFGTTSPLRSVLRAALVAFTLNKTLLEKGLLLTLAGDSVPIAPSEVDMVLESIRSAVLQDLRSFCTWTDDWGNGVYVFSDDGHNLKDCANMLAWAWSCGVGEGIFAIYQMLRARFPDPLPDSQETRGEQMVQYLRGYGAPREPQP